MKDNVLIFEPKKKRRPFGVVGDAVYMLYYANKERAGRFTVRSGHPLVRGLTELFVAKPVYQLFKLLRKFTFTCHEWKGSVACKVITS